MGHKTEVRILHFAVPRHTVHAYRISIKIGIKIDVSVTKIVNYAKILEGIL